MNRLQNGIIAWLAVLLCLAIALAVAKGPGRPLAQPQTDDGFGAAPENNLSLVNPGQREVTADAWPAITSTPARRPGRTVTTIIVHHSESVHGDVAAIDQWHRERGWDGVGYHYVITNGVTHSGVPCYDGEIQVGRDEERVGAHARGRNRGSIGVCLIGTDAFTPAQVRSLRTLLIDLCRRHGITPSAATIQRHHDQCPGTGLDLGAVITGAAAEPDRG